MTFRKVPPHFVIKPGIASLGVFVTKDIKKGRIVFKMKGEILKTPTRTSVQVENNHHIEDILGSHVNHSCEPSAKVRKKDRAFISLKDIKKGEEITFDYNKNENKLASPFPCSCCGKKITGRKKLP